MNLTQNITFPVPLTRKMRDTAIKFSQYHHNESKARQIYLNTLAVLAVDFYCQCMEIETQLNQSNSWDVTMQFLMDVADLNIKDIGKIECRPVIKGEEFCHFPPEIWEDIMGYIVVEIDEQANKATLLGYLSKVNQEQIPLNQLHSLADFLTDLEQLQIGAVAAMTTAVGGVVTGVVTTVENTVIELTKWFDNIFGNGWQPEERALTLGIQPARNLQPANTEQPEVNGAKVIRLGMQIPQETVILILRQKQLSEGEIEVNLRLYPSADAMYLPDGVQLIVLDEIGNPIPQLEAQARADNWIQLKFIGEPGDQFSVKVSLEDSSITEHFLI